MPRFARVASVSAASGAAHERRQARLVADRRQPDAARRQLGALLEHEPAQQPHQVRHLGRGPLPVLRRERVQRQYRMPSSRAARTTRRTASAPCAVAVASRAAARRGPAAVAVHDDRDVLGKWVQGGLLSSRKHRRVTAGRAAISANGRDATPSRRARGVTGDRPRARMMEERTRACATPAPARAVDHPQHAAGAAAPAPADPDRAAVGVAGRRAGRTTAATRSRSRWASRCASRS